MCEQCLTSMLSVYSGSGEIDQSMYAGIVRRGYVDIYEPGDIFVGYMNNPDIVIRLDLFTEFHYNKGLLDFETYSEHLFHGKFWSIDTLNNPWSQLPVQVVRLVDHFGSPPSHLKTIEPWVIIKIAEYFRKAGIPLKKNERAKWAKQFGRHVNHIIYQGSYGLGRPELGSRYREYECVFNVPAGEVNESGWDDFKVKELKWSTEYSIPDVLRPKDGDFETVTYD